MTAEELEVQAERDRAQARQADMPYDSRDVAHSVTSQMLVGLLVGNLLAILCALASLPFPRTTTDFSDQLVMYVGTLSLLASGLAFVIYATRRGGRLWWAAATALNVTQLARLVPAIVAIAVWVNEGAIEGMFWGVVFVPFLGLLLAVGIMLMLRELRKSRRRKLARAA